MGDSMTIKATRSRTLAGMAVVIGTALSLGGCQTMGGPVASAPTVNGDASIATALNAPAGSNEDFVINVGRRVFFSENSSELNATAKVTLDKQATWLASYPDYRIKIEGFADEKGTPEFNRELGMKRAESMAAYLRSKGIVATRIKTKTFGNERFVNKCADISCWSQNRRGITVLVSETET